MLLTFQDCIHTLLTVALEMHKIEMKGEGKKKRKREQEEKKKKKEKKLKRTKKEN